MNRNNRDELTKEQEKYLPEDRQKLIKAGFLNNDLTPTRKAFEAWFRKSVIDEGDVYKTLMGAVDEFEESSPSPDDLPF